jgi:hypothetical protein
VVTARSAVPLALDVTSCAAAVASAAVDVVVATVWFTTVAAVDVTGWVVEVALVTADATGSVGAVTVGAGADATVCWTAEARSAVAIVRSVAGAGAVGVVVTLGRPARAMPVKPAAVSNTPTRSAVRTSHRVAAVDMTLVFPICKLEESNHSHEKGAICRDETRVARRVFREATAVTEEGSLNHAGARATWRAQ